MPTKRDYYTVLGIQKGAGADDIKRAYRKLARKFHPDVNRNDPSAEGKFKEVQEAYDVLSDPKRRTAYDQFGHAGVSSSAAADAAAAAAAAGRGTGGFRYSTSTPGGATVDFGDVDLNDLLQSFMSGNRRGGRRSRSSSSANSHADGAGANASTEQAGQNIIHEVNITFEQAMQGLPLDLRFDAAGGGHTETISVKIPPGVDEGSKVRVRGKGQPSPYGGPRGDLIIVTHVQPHPYFTRVGKDIMLDLPISASEAVSGATISVPTLEGEVSLRVPPGITSGKRLRIANRGVPQRGGTRGDQFCRILVKLPPDLNEEEKRQIKEIDQNHHFNPRQDIPW